MNTAAQKIAAIRDGRYDTLFTTLYGKDQISLQRSRYIEALEAFTEQFGERDEVFLFSAPGRTEIGGNHTDHNHGHVLAGSVDLDVIAVAAPTGNDTVRIKSKGFPMDTVTLDQLDVKEAEMNHSCSLIRGVIARFHQLKLAIGGFDAYTTSNVLKGSGLSSSAAFEVLVGTVMSHLFNDGSVSAVEIAKIAQYAENVYFGKPSGLMDQMASSVGGIVSIDFKDTEKPIIEPVDFDFAASGYRLCIVDTAGSHADLTNEYAAIPYEMKEVAEELGANYLRDTTLEKLMAAIPALRQKFGDRAILRSLHFFREDARVGKQVEALNRNDFKTFCDLIVESGHSSFEYLQNVYASCDVTFQGLSIALCLAQMMLDGKGAWRVHGGGFGGTTQNFVPVELLDSFKETVEGVFGKGSCHVLMIRPFGGISVDKEAGACAG